MNENEKVILPSNAAFVYSGRIDFTEKEAPVLVFPCTSIRFVMSGKTGRIQIENRHVWNENSLGILVDGEHKGRMVLPDSGRAELDFSGYLDGAENDYAHVICFAPHVPASIAELSAHAGHVTLFLCSDESWPEALYADNVHVMAFTPENYLRELSYIAI